MEVFNLLKIFYAIFSVSFLIWRVNWGALGLRGSSSRRRKKTRTGKLGHRKYQSDQKQLSNDFLTINYKSNDNFEEMKNKKCLYKKTIFGLMRWGKPCPKTVGLIPTVPISKSPAGSGRFGSNAHPCFSFEKSLTKFLNFDSVLLTLRFSRISHQKWILKNLNLFHTENEVNSKIATICPTFQTFEHITRFINNLCCQKALT